VVLSLAEKDAIWFKLVVKLKTKFNKKKTVLINNLMPFILCRLLIFLRRYWHSK